MQHTPPSTYILRNMKEVAPLEPVPFWPGFEHLPTGWWCAMIAFLAIGIYLAVRYIRFRWNNRYRHEALSALAELEQHIHTSPEHDKHGKRLFFIIKQVLAYLNPQYASLNDHQVLTILTQMSGGDAQTSTWQSEIGERWISSLYSSKTKLNQNELLTLNSMAKQWVLSHEGGRG